MGAGKLIEATEVFAMAAPSRKRDSQAPLRAGESQVPIFSPQPRSPGRSGARGRSAQTFLSSEESVALDSLLREVGLTKGDYLRWLITYAIASRLKPEGF